MDSATIEAIASLSASLAQLGIGVAALKVAIEVRSAVRELRALFQNHEIRIGRLEER